MRPICSTYNIRLEKIVVLVEIDRDSDVHVA